MSLVFSGIHTSLYRNRKFQQESLARAMLHGNVGWYTAEYATVFLHPDWLYFQWRDIKSRTGLLKADLIFHMCKSDNSLVCHRQEYLKLSENNK